MINAIIIDDEARSRRTLHQMLDEYCPNVSVVAQAHDVLSGIKAIHIHQPHLVFLDIEMPNYSGFQLVDYFENPSFHIIFTTAYEKYALKAFKTSATAYLLKPISIDELIDIINRVEKLLKIATKEENPPKGKDVNQTNPNHLIWPAQNGWIYTSYEEIFYFESEGRYTHIYLEDNSRITTTSSLKDCQSMLINSTFIRVHRSYIVNLIHVKRYSKGRDSFVIMDNDIRIDVGKNFRNTLNQVVAHFVR